MERLLATYRKRRVVILGAGFLCSSHRYVDPTTGGSGCLDLQGGKAQEPKISTLRQSGKSSEELVGC